ncbi:hypothetical protein K1T71_011644 [Dendrolimus kikuchii]|uniref:Uncharacterized protein n=1 Tax=Dendrolimus kikuchii TaxID=765133 RepID=A0ACC1CLM9_9NEOP|nr:hypothetical protein K1T71_011644 [Dendrolimus kikuchii]
MAEEKIEKLMKKRSCMKSKLTIFNNFLNAFETSSTSKKLKILDLESRLKKFENLYADFDKLQCDIEMLAEDLDNESEEREMFEDHYHQLIATARSILGARCGSAHARNDSVASFKDAQAAESQDIPF